MSSREELAVWSQADNMLEGITISEDWSSNFLSLKLTFVNRSDLWNQLMLTKLKKQMYKLEYHLLFCNREDIAKVSQRSNY